MRLLLFALFALFPGLLRAQADERVGVQTINVVGTRSIALGGAGVALGGWSSLNPAFLATTKQPGLSLYADQGFGLTELRTGALHLTYPFSFATLAAGAQTLGFDAYRVSNLSLAAGRAFSLGTLRTFDAGVALTLHHAQIQGYGSGAALSLDAGFRVSLLPELAVGASGQNLTASRLGGVEPVPQVLRVGLAYLPAARLAVTGDVVKDARYPLSARGGVELTAVEALLLRVGGGTAPTSFSAGMGLRLGIVRVDLAATRHAWLGWSPALELGLAW